MNEGGRERETAFYFLSGCDSWLHGFRMPVTSHRNSEGENPDINRTTRSSLASLYALYLHECSLNKLVKTKRKNGLHPTRRDPQTSVLAEAVSHTNESTAQREKMEHTSDLQRSTEALKPRAYQLEIVEKALQGNTIACLGTGSGKTFIAILLIKEMSADVRGSYLDGAKRTIFLVPSGMDVSEYPQTGRFTLCVCVWFKFVYHRLHRRPSHSLSFQISFLVFQLLFFSFLHIYSFFFFFFFSKRSYLEGFIITAP